MTTLHQELVAVGRRLVERGLVTGSFGNASVRLPGSDRVLVTPSGLPYEHMHTDDLVVLSLEGKVVEGSRKPTSEAPMHLAVYRARADVGAVIHTHSVHATTLACAELPIEPVHYLMAGIGHRVPVAPFAVFGTPEIGAAAVDVLRSEYQAVLLAQHGVLTVGRDLEAAFFVAETVEYVAEIACRLMAMGLAGVRLTADQLHQTERRFYRRAE
jgi:L-fuculose-phosphate aldolase